MKYYLLLFCLSILPVLEKENNKISLYTYWKKGDTQKIVIKEGYEKYEDGEIVEKEVTISRAIITVLEESDTNYIVEWNYYDMKTERLNVDAEEDELDKRLDEMFENEKLIYEINEFGEYQKLLNLDDVLKSISDSIDVLIGEEMTDLGEDAELFASMMKEMMTSETVRNEMDRDIYNYHYCFGGTYNADTIINYTDELENKLGGENIPVVGALTIKADTLNKTIILNDFKSVNEEKAIDAINDAAKELKAKKRKKLKRELQKNNINIKDIENYTYDYYLGWLKYYERNRIYETDGKRTERFIIIEEVE